MSWYGDKQSSGIFFRKSLDTVQDVLKDCMLMKEKRLNYLHPKLVLHCIHANFCAVRYLEYAGATQHMCYDGISMGCRVSIIQSFKQGLKIN